MARNAFRTATLFLSLSLVFALGFAGATERTIYSFYDLNVTLEKPQQSTFAPGSAVDFTVGMRNNEAYAFEGYLIVTQVYGCEKPNPYNFNLTDCGTLAGKTIRKVRVESGNSTAVPVSELVPVDARPGIWRMDVYLMMNNTFIDGNYVAYDPQHYFSYTVTGSGNYPKVTVLQTRTQAAGGYAQSGPAVPASGPTSGYVEIRTMDDSTFTGKLEMSYCAFDDYMGNCKVFDTKGINMAAGQPYGTIYTIPDTLERGAYSVLYRVLEGSDNRVVAEYKNRLIVSGKTANIISIDAYKEAYEKGELMQMRLSFTGPFYPARDVVDNISAKTTVYDGSEAIYTQTEKYASLKPDEVKVIQYAFKAPRTLVGYSVCLELEGTETSKKSCSSFGKPGGAQQPAGEATPTAQPSRQATGQPTATAGQPKAGGDYLAAAAAVLVVAALVAYWLFRNQKPPTTMVVVLLLMLAAPFARAVDCPAFGLYFDSNGNGVYDSGEPVMSAQSVGSVYYLPIYTVIVAGGQCSYSYSYNTCTHWCGNTATSCSTVSGTGYYTHYVTVASNPVTLAPVEVRADNTSALTKQAIVDMIKKYTFTDFSFATNADPSIYQNLAAAGLPDFPFSQVENDTNKVDDYIMRTVLQSYCGVAANNCTYSNNQSGGYGTYNYTGYQYYLRNFTINNYTLRNLPVNYTHKNGTEMRLAVNYTLYNYTVFDYPIDRNATGNYTINNYTLRDFVYTYRVNATNTYSFVLSQYTIPKYYVVNYTVYGGLQTKAYYVKWEPAFTEMFNRGLIVGVMTTYMTVIVNPSSVLATNVNTYRIPDTGVYYLTHTYA